MENLEESVFLDLLIKYRNWDRDWNNYWGNGQLLPNQKPPNAKEFIKILESEFNLTRK